MSSFEGSTTVLTLLAFLTGTAFWPFRYVGRGLWSITLYSRHEPLQFSAALSPI